MNFDDYKPVKHNLNNKQKKTIAIALVLILLVLLVVFFNSERLKNEKEKGDLVNGIGTPESKIELIQKIHTKEINNVGELELGMCYTQLILGFSDLHWCAIGVEKTSKLYLHGFKTEALFEYATVICQVINEKLKLLDPGIKTQNFYDGIELAYKKNLISSKQRNFLHKLRKLRNKKAHLPGVEVEHKIVELYLKKGTIILHTKLVG